MAASDPQTQRQSGRKGKMVREDQDELFRKRQDIDQQHQRERLPQVQFPAGLANGAQPLYPDQRELHGIQIPEYKILLKLQL